MHILNEYIQFPKTKRQEHLVLNEPCMERGGNSTNHKGVLAEFLNTTIPSGGEGYKIHLCHNDKCSNPRHLYWGTNKENINDAKINGTWKGVWERTVEKYGYEEACRRNIRT